MKHSVKTGLLAAATFILELGYAQATPMNMETLGQTNPPIGHYEFCKTNPGECTRLGSDPGPQVLTKELWKTILSVNYNVNTEIQPLTDMEIYGVEERWAYPRTVGDCEDFALLKRKMLIKAGMSPADLLITVVLQPSGEGHAVLTARTDRGDFILDNMRNKVLLWSDTEYTYLKRQSETDSKRWVKLEDGHVATVGSVN